MQNQEKPPLAADSEQSSAVVNSLLHPLAVRVRQLLTRSGRNELARILIDDEENIAQALTAGVKLEAVFYTSDLELSPALRARLPQGVAIHEIAWRTCKKLFDKEKVTRVFAIAETPAQADLQALVGLPQDLVVLEDVSIAGNIGAIVRTSVALGAGALVAISEEPMDVFDRRLIRASRGLVFMLKVVTTTPERLIDFCRQQRISLVVTVAQEAGSTADLGAVQGRAALVFGAEKHGCSAALVESADVRLHIPLHPAVESLNVSTAAAIVLYQRLGFNARAWPKS